MLHCLRHYREDDDRRYGLEHQGELVPFEFTSACLLGLDARPFVLSVATSIRQLLDQFDSPDAAIVGLVATEDRRVLIEDADRLCSISFAGSGWRPASEAVVSTSRISSTPMPRSHSQAAADRA